MLDAGLAHSTKSSGPGGPRWHGGSSGRAGMEAERGRRPGAREEQHANAELVEPAMTEQREPPAMEAQGEHRAGTGRGRASAGQRGPPPSGLG